MDILLGFTPYVAFFLAMRIAAAEAAMWAASAVAVLVALNGRRRGRSPKILEIGAIALFGALALSTAVMHWEWTLMALRLAVDLGLLTIVLTSIAIGRPFAMQYARERVAREYWHTPLFFAVNRRITWVWAAAFAVMVTAHAATVCTFVPGWVDPVATIFALAYAANFTARYPERARKAARLQGAA